MSIDPIILERAQQWLHSKLDDEIRNEVQRMIDADPEELTEAFYRDLEFGTGGLRGIMGVGTNRMNKVTVAMATQGLANYLKKEFDHLPQIKVAIAYDSRNYSAFFALISAEVLSANGIKVYLADHLRPTPWLSFAVRQLQCQSGIVITASHNPKEYNGYKVYWDDGGQLIPPHDKNVIAEVQKITDINKINFNENADLIERISDVIDVPYLDKVASLSLKPDCILQHSPCIVYTALHGTGVTMVPPALGKFGFQEVHLVDEQCRPDGNFPTLKSPNPEESSALQMAIEKARSLNADLVMATDPDADRVGIAVKDDKDEFILFNGNQTATVLIWYLLEQWKQQDLIKWKELIVKTIVTTELLNTMAKTFGVECLDVLTGFKYIAEAIRENEDMKTFIGGGEESYGYLVGDFVRDKDAVISCCMIAEIAAYARSMGKSFFELYQEICVVFGLYHEDLISVTKKGKQGAEDIRLMMDNYRQNPPTKIAGSPIVAIFDYQSRTKTCLKSGTISSITLPVSDVLQFILEDESKITIRPSGTEPKIKFYFGVRDQLASAEKYAETSKKLKARIGHMITSMGLK